MKKTVKVSMLAGALAIGLGLSACSAGPAENGDSPSDMVVYGSSGAIEDAMIKVLLPKFEKENNVKVTYVGMPAAQALLKSQASRANPEASLVIANELVADVGASEGLWQKLDLNSMPTLAGLPDALIADGTAAATGYWTVGITYNHELYKANNITPPTEWEDLFDPAVSSHVVQYDIGWGYTAPFMYVWNSALGGSYDNFEPVLGKMVDGRHNFQSIAPAAADFDQAFSQKVAWVGVQASMRGGIAIAAGEPNTMVYPSSGVPKMITPGMVPTGAPEPKLGQALLDFLLTPESQAIYAGTQYYVPVNPATELPEKVKAVLPKLDELNLIQIDWMKLQKALPGLTSSWQQRVLVQ